MSESKTKKLTLSERVKKQLGDRVKGLEKQPSTIANGGLTKIISRVTERMTDSHPHALSVAVVKVLGACGSKPTKEDKAAK